MIETEKAVLEMTPKRKIDLWKVDDTNPEFPLVVMGYGVWIRANFVAHQVWEMCTGERTVSEIVEALLALYPAEPRAGVERDVVEFLTEFDQKKLLVLDYDPLSF
jgi:hypothetical protein